MRLLRLPRNALGAWLGTALMVFAASAAAHSVVAHDVGAPAARPDVVLAVASDVSATAPVSQRAPLLVSVGLPPLRAWHRAAPRHAAGAQPRRTAPVAAAVPVAAPVATPGPAPAPIPARQVVVTRVRVSASPAVRPAAARQAASLDSSG